MTELEIYKAIFSSKTNKMKVELAKKIIEHEYTVSIKWLNKRRHRYAFRVRELLLKAMNQEECK